MNPIFMRRATGAGEGQREASSEVSDGGARALPVRQNPLLRAVTLCYKVLSMNLPRLILGTALVVGIAADVLLRAGFDGIAFPLWISIVALAALALASRERRPLSREATGWLVVAVLAATGLAWRAASDLQPLDFLASLLALGLAAVALGQPQASLLCGRLRDVAWAGARVLRDVFIGAVPLALREVVMPSSRGQESRRAWPMIRTALIVLALVAVFGSLLRGADPIFASLLAVPDFDFGRLMEHLVMIGFFAWVFAGWSRGAFISSASASRPPERLPISLGMTDMTAALVTLDVLFALFILAQLGWLFGGEAFLQARTGLTAAEYARRGFFQMVFVVILVVPLLMAVRTLLVAGVEPARRYARLAIPMVVLLVAMLTSAAFRMRLYMDYYGLTTDRFHTLAIMAWLAFVLIWLGATTLRGRGRHFAAGAVIAGFVTLGALNVLVPDRVVARVNVARAQLPTSAGGTPLDLDYLSTLSGDAMATAIAATLAPPANVRSSTAGALGATRETSPVAQQCLAARRILERWGPASRAAARRDEPGAWRSWNPGVSRALRLAAEHARALREVRHAACAEARRLAPNAGVRAVYR
jgi:hypothetical protein